MRWKVEYNPWVGFLLFFLCWVSCSKKFSERQTATLLISEPLLNRVEDKRAPVEVTRKWVHALRKISFDVEYYEESHSTHFVYLGDPEREFYKKVGTNVSPLLMSLSQ